MREFATPWDGTPRSAGSLTDDIVVNASEHPDSIAFSRRTGANWEPVTAAQFHTEVRAVAKGLLAAGIEPGTRVALLSRTRYEWTLFDYAIWYVGAVTVPIYETSSPAQVEWILADSGASALVVDSPAHEARLEEARSRLGRSSRTPGSSTRTQSPTLTRLGALVSDEDLDRRRDQVTPDSVATVIYTSGTTGLPEGVHPDPRQLHVRARGRPRRPRRALRSRGRRRPCSSSRSRTSSRASSRSAACGPGFASPTPRDAKTLVADLGDFRPTFILAVPRVFEKLFNTASQNARIDGRGGIFDRAVDTAIAYSRALDIGRPGPFLRARHAVFDRLVYGRIRAALGGRCPYAVSGGAPLGERLGHFYRGIGVTVLEGYGLTETTAAVTVNRPGAVRVGTVGQPLPGTTVRVEPDGELVVRGGQVMRGYWNNDDATAEVLDDDGWLHTGDIGDIDDEGFVRITGRKKEILVTAGGKNVAPAPLEDRIRAHYLVSQCLVVGDGRPFIGALITLDAEAVDALGGPAREGRRPHRPERGPRAPGRGPDRCRRQRTNPCRRRSRCVGL